ncbi:bacteriorhodopsin [Halopiger goleimassiliensis]|uniref:bacteriorhodopsin n=1 Tax=Halopiger goleimassiliensis TaxID=1293048 RepID=UPI0006777534|nr:bacteriorhodopsin [Halopiger goleimassiliensis]
MLDANQLLAISALVFVVTTLAFLVWSRSLSPESRRYGYVVTIAAGAMAVSYVVMTAIEFTNSGTTDLVRFLGYTGLWLPIIYVIAAVAGVGTRLTGVLYAIVLGRVWITYVAGFLDGVLATVGSLTPIALLFAGIYVLFGPYTHVVNTQSPQRRLLFNKLKYLVVLAWIGLVVNGLISGMGLVDDFVGQISLIYVEGILVIGFGGIVLRSPDALEDTAEAGAAGDDGSLERVEAGDSQPAD